MKRKPGKRIALWIALIVAALFSGLPIVWLVSSSLKSNANIFAVPPKLVDESFSFTAYKEVLSDPAKLRFFLNSYTIAGIVVIITLVIALLAAYSFSRFEFPGKKIINTIIISVQAVPPITLLIPYLVLVVKLRIYDSYLALIVTYVVFTLPYAILMLTGYLKSVQPLNRRYYRSLLPVIVGYAAAAAISIPIRHFAMGDRQTFGEWLNRFMNFSGCYYGW